METNTDINEKNQTQEQQPVQEQSKTCFVIMPISDTEGYDSGHFDRVYEYLIKPACEKAGVIPRRADKTTKANHIVIDILKQVLDSDIAICDLSSRNSNVFFELGLRQAFNLKTVLIKDTNTSNSFDIAELRFIEYKASLRIDEVQVCIDKIAQSLRDTMNGNPDDVYSLIQLLSIESPAKLSEKVKLNDDTSYIINEIKNLREDLQYHSYVKSAQPEMSKYPLELPNGEYADIGDRLYLNDGDFPFYKPYGTIVSAYEGKISIRLEKSRKVIILDDQNPKWSKLTIKDSAI